jgi:carbonic anhydrase/acetyltransferase-like protein (isoleucine patch superfamily)
MVPSSTRSAEPSVAPASPSAAPIGGGHTPVHPLRGPLPATPGAVRTLLVLVVGLLPASRVKNLLLRGLGHRVHPSARVSPCLLMRVGRLDLAARARIGTGTVIRSVRLVRFAEDSGVLQWNWISAVPAFARYDPDDDRPGTFVMGRHAALMSRHYLDVSGGVSIGAFTSIAGVRSTFITHGVDVTTNTQRPHPIVIGERCLISSNIVFVPGCSIPDRCLVAMGSVVKGDLPLAGHLYAGSPATAKRPVDGDHFDRTEGYVSVSQQGDGDRA